MRILFLGLILGVAIGCQPSNNDEMVVTEAPKVAFEGQPDPALAGKFRADGRPITYEFKDDGTYHMTGKVPSPGGMQEVNNKGRWAIDSKKRLLMEDEQKNVLPYIYELKGKTLTMTLDGRRKVKTVLVKQ